MLAQAAQTINEVRGKGCPDPYSYHQVVRARMLAVYPDIIALFDNREALPTSRRRKDRAESLHEKRGGSRVISKDVLLECSESEIC